MTDSQNAPVSAEDRCVCGHDRSLHGRESDGTLGLCIKDEWCQCPGYMPRASDERYEQIMREWGVGRLGL